MWKHLIFLCLVLGFARLYGLDLTPYHQKIIDFIAYDNLKVLTETIGLSLVLIMTALLTKGSVVLGVIRLIIRLLKEIGLFAVTFVSVGALYWAIWEDGNLWWEYQSLLPIPAILLATAAICTNIIDFNHPITKALIPYAVLATASFLIVNLALT